ncbi:MAG: hypothetical protein JRL30_07975 [Deltaproteobacteria bacterium]|jgi:hypothetical protein|nr:hypothetical protein [Deltaproteobacteria bacterium]
MGMERDSVLREMKAKIDGMETLARELRALGGAVPVIEKNVRCILSFTHALRFGISDIAQMDEQPLNQGGLQWER